VRLRHPDSQQVSAHTTGAGAAVEGTEQYPFYFLKYYALSKKKGY